MEWTTTTIQGDTWDALALDLYGTEMLAWWLQQANPKHLGTIIFPAGVVLRVPDTPAGAAAQPRRRWED